MIDPYAIFEINKNANQEMIKQRYRILVQKWHPDKYESASEEDKETARKNFTMIQDAYRILIDPDRRNLYDETGFIEPTQNEISRSVETSLRTLITSYLAQGDQIFIIDIIKEINTYCDKNIGSAKDKIESLKKKKVFLNKVLKRFKKKKQLNRDFLTHIFISEFNALDQSINGQLKMILILSQLKNVINAYEFDYIQVIMGTIPQNPPNRVPLGNIFDLAGVNKNNDSK